MNEVKIKGLTTELQCQLYFTQLGYNVSVPLGEDCRYDMIIDLNGVLCRVQVKTCHINNTGKGIEFATRSTQANTQEAKSKTYSKEEIDYFATFYEGKCYLVRVEECSTQKTLNFSPQRVNQTPVCFIEDYEAEKQIQKIINGENEIIIENKIYQYDLRNNLLNSYESCHEAARALGDVKKNAHISQAVRGIRKTAYGYKWTDTLIKS